ncbi:putative transcriptional regulator ManR [Paenibacillus larvae subsp. larvae]|nr:transcription antiterminator [Paenibacillus larvae]AVF25579.1 putative transcriptional regulator ManR [Paenibacillus larvae subsp. larvae]AVF30356.1 putative transcriptional regulator ManR [Paenibacillus larvae subsp. larvae]MBH0340892.1 hypothetical protein [Paenibacillus larvae]MCY7521653.1 transcription antiterminator [Paenibacillus larvae]MCY9502495.1 transcription antiterminator [Paenibacillus larvae]
MLNTRAKDMLLRMIVSGHPVRIKHLAEEFHVSTRTIKYDIESIRLWLNEQHLCLQSHTKRGIWIECSEEKKNKLRELLDSGERSAIFPSQEERNTQILLILLNRSDYVTASELAEWLGTSRNTILRDLLKGERMLQQWNLDLERKQYKGFKVKGPELYKRLLLEYLAQNLLDASDMFRMIQGVLRREPIPPDIKKILAPHLLPYGEMENVFQAVHSLIKMLEEKLNLLLTDQEMIGLLFRFSIAIRRIRDNERIQIEAISVKAIKQSASYKIVLEGLTDLGLQMGIKFPEEEAVYVSMQLIVGREELPGLPSTEYGMPDLANVARRLIKLVSKKLGYPFEKDPDLFEYLISHLSSKLLKARLGVLDPNPITDQVIRSYGTLFIYVKEACEEIFSDINLLLVDFDVAYLVIHFQESYERLQQNVKYKALFVCGTGRGTARLIKRLMENRIPQLEVAGYCSVMEVSKLLEQHSVDLVISVLPIELPVPVVRVNPIPTKDDIIAVLNCLKQLKPSVSHFMGDLSRSSILIKRPGLSEALKCVREKDVSLIEQICRDVIMKGFEISQATISMFRSFLTEQSAAALVLHLQLMVHRQTFGKPYGEQNIGNLLLSDEQKQVKLEVERLFEQFGVPFTESEFNAILHYFSVEKSGDTDE